MNEMDLHTFANMCEGVTGYCNGKFRAQVVYGMEKTKKDKVTVKGIER